MNHADRDALVRMLTKAGKAVPSHTLTRLIRMAEAYAKIQEDECNRELTEREREIERKAAELIRTIARELEIGVKLGGDPRGYTVKILLADPSHEGQNFYNTWGGSEEGWGIA